MPMRFVSPMSNVDTSDWEAIDDVSSEYSTSKSPSVESRSAYTAGSAAGGPRLP